MFFNVHWSISTACWLHQQTANKVRLKGQQIILLLVLCQHSQVERKVLAKIDKLPHRISIIAADNKYDVLILLLVGYGYESWCHDKPFQNIPSSDITSGSVHLQMYDG